MRRRNTCVAHVAARPSLAAESRCACGDRTAAASDDPFHEGQRLGVACGDQRRVRRGRRGSGRFVPPSAALRGGHGDVSLCGSRDKPTACPRLVQRPCREGSFWHIRCDAEGRERIVVETSRRRTARIDRHISDDEVFEHVIQGVRLSALLSLIWAFARMQASAFKELSHRNKRHLRAV